MTHRAPARQTRSRADVRAPGRHRQPPSGTDHLDRWGLEGRLRARGRSRRASCWAWTMSRRAGLRDFSGGGWVRLRQLDADRRAQSLPRRRFCYNPDRRATRRRGTAAALFHARSTTARSGGREHDWTLGANWVTSKKPSKLQANYIRSTSERALARWIRVFRAARAAGVLGARIPATRLRDRRKQKTPLSAFSALAGTPVSPASSSVLDEVVHHGAAQQGRRQQAPGR